MFLEREKPKMDDFEKKKENKLWFLTYTLAKSSKFIFSYSFVSEHSKHFYFILRKHIFSGEGVTRPRPSKVIHKIFLLIDIDQH